MKGSYRFFIILLFCVAIHFLPLKAHAQQKTFNYGLKLRGSASSGDYLPFWLYSNKHGAVDMNAPGGSAILDFHKNLSDDHSGFDYGFGATFVSRYSEHKAYYFNQLYLSLAYGNFQIKGGRFYEQLGDVDPSLSMGSLAISPNATPLPKVKIGFLHYTNVPFTHGYAKFKAEIAHGWFEKNRLIKNPWLHQKSVHIRLGGDLPVNIYAGLIDEATWAGTSPQVGNLPDTFNDFLRVFASRSAGDATVSGENVYRLGDHRGIWDLGINAEVSGFKIHAYRQQIFNDADGLKFKTPDGMTGIEIKLPAKHQHYVTKLILENLFTKDQSGPIPPGNYRGGPGGRDNYYNNYLYRTGWTYFHRTIGNPLFLNAYNPQLNVVSNYQLDTDHPFGIVNNRIVADHFGIAGQLAETLRYKLLATWSRNYGMYWDRDLYEQKGLKTDFYSNPEQWSLLAKFIYQPFDNLRINTSLAGDFGKLYKNRVGIMIGIELLGFSSF